MSNEKFATMCAGAARMLDALADQARKPSAAGELQFQIKSVPEATKTLAEIIVAIAESAC